VRQLRELARNAVKGWTSDDMDTAAPPREQAAMRLQFRPNCQQLTQAARPPPTASSCCFGLNWLWAGFVELLVSMVLIQSQASLSKKSHQFSRSSHRAD
jgi:hypothetical protein